MKKVISSESVSIGHPDLVADYIADSILDECLARDESSRVGCEVMVKDNVVVLGGEITTKADFDYEKVVRRAIKDIGYVKNDCAFKFDTVKVINLLGHQSPDIAQGVDAREAEGKSTNEQGAGDIGMMFGYATSETESYMPLNLVLCRKILGNLYNKYLDNLDTTILRPDSKCQIAMEYDGNTPVKIKNIVVCQSHSDSFFKDFLFNIVKESIAEEVPGNLMDSETKIYINPTGKFSIYGPEGDCGITGRKLIVQSYGGHAKIGGGAQSGKDPSKVDRSAMYMCRYVAKNIVAQGLAEKCEVQVAYAIGEPEPTSIYVDTFGTGKRSEEELIKMIKNSVSFKPAEIINRLNLLNTLYSPTVIDGQVGGCNFPWEKLDLEFK